MGSCVSVHKTSSASGSAIKLVTFGSKRDKLVTPASPINADVTPAVDASPPIDSGHWLNYGTKDEIFLDSQLWLESDCEDDFFSVNGDFTPSRGTTPVHHSFTVDNERPSPPTPPETADEKLPNSVVGQTSPSMIDNKKKLVELFREIPEEEEEEEQALHGVAAGKGRAKTRSSAPATPFISWTSSFCGSERTVNAGDYDYSVTEKHRRLGSVHGCVSRLVSCSSFSERRRRRAMSPAVSVDGTS